MLSTVRRLHDRLVSRRRALVLSRSLSKVIPARASILDVGCGDGVIGSLIERSKVTISIRGLEVMFRPSCMIECQIYNGRTIPSGDSSVDVCMFVDVLHHTADPLALLKEACRVSRRYVLIKDHLSESTADQLILRLMDWVGNRPHGVALFCNYRSKNEWHQLFQSCGLRVVIWDETLQLYGPVLNAVFGRHLHFIAQLEKAARESDEDANQLAVALAESAQATMAGAESEDKFSETAGRGQHISGKHAFYSMGAGLFNYASE
jgi:SAM-dependent methyltransferase